MAAASAWCCLVRRPRTVVDAPSSLAEPYSSVLAFRYDGALPTPPHRGADRRGRGPARARARRPGGRAWSSASPPGIGARHETFRRYLLLGSPLALGVVRLLRPLHPGALEPRRPSFDWPIEMRRPHPIGWLAVLLLVADVVVDRVWQARRTDT